MKKLIMLTILVAAILNSYAQEGSGNYVIGLLPVTVSDNAAKKYCAQLEGIIAGVFTGKTRFTVVDRTKLDQIAKERNLQKQEEFLDGLIVEQGKSLGAQYLIQANISQANAVAVQIKKYKTVGTYPNTYQQAYTVPGYEVALIVNLQTIDVATGQAKSARTINASKTWATTSAEQAIAASLNLLQNPTGREGTLKDWANDMFPVAMKILKVEETDNKGRPKKVLIKGGEDMDLHRGAVSGSKLQVYINDAMMVDGKEYIRPLPIGEIVVFEPQGEFTVCKVKDGADEMQRRMNEGKTLFLKMLKW